jgi:putative endonuclease
MKQPAVYMLANERNGTLYIGVTSNLIQRIWQHREGILDGFTHEYSVKVLVWYEMHVTMETAIRREKALKKWNRAWKLKLIEERNPDWIDLWSEINGEVMYLKPLFPVPHEGELKAMALARHWIPAYAGMTVPGV